IGVAFENTFLLRTVGRADCAGTAGTRVTPGGCDGPACSPSQDSRQAPVHAGHGRGHADHRDHGLAVGADLRAHAARAGGLPVLLLVPAHPGAGDLRAVLDLLPAAADQADQDAARCSQPRRHPSRHPGGSAMNHVNAVTLTILVASFLLVTLIGFASARWRPRSE